MACLRFSQEVTSACRNSQPGVSTVYIANYDSILSFTTDTAGVVLSGLTASGETTAQKCFYQLAQNKNVASFLDTATINIQNGTAISKPKLTIKLQGLADEVIQIYKELLQATVVAVVKTIDGKYYALGFNNGLDAITATLGTEAASDGFKGASFELEGIEATPFYLLDDTAGGLASTFIATYTI
jgi:hypothetical protein